MASASAKRTRATAALLMLGLSACVARTPATVSLRVKGNVPDASVTIDDQYIGALAYVAAHGVALPPGAHRITVEKAGYFAVMLEPSAATEATVALPFVPWVDSYPEGTTVVPLTARVRGEPADGAWSLRLTIQVP